MIGDMSRDALLERAGRIVIEVGDASRTARPDPTDSNALRATRPHLLIGDGALSSWCVYC